LTCPKKYILFKEEGAEEHCPCGSVADGTSGTGNGKVYSGGVALNGGHTHQGCTDAIGKMCFNPP
jgi:hypothetical protein